MDASCICCDAPISNPANLVCDDCWRERRLLDLADMGQEQLASGTYDYHRIHAELKARIECERGQSGEVN